MPRKFAEITFTPSVKAAQEHWGSRESNRGFELMDEDRAILTDREITFIEARDGFYQATVSETGWPYVQFRGGPPGFLKVLDDHTIGFADFRGNVQYLSVGNLAANDRIALILMDYAARRRLKIWARARVVDARDDPDLVARLEVATYRARVERAMVLTVEAFDWNCPQHITPRFTEAEITQAVQTLHGRIAELEAELRQAPRPSVATTLGTGPLSLAIAGIRQLTPEIRAYELRPLDGGPLPPIEPGAHLEVPVPSGAAGETRPYSISTDPARDDVWEIAVRRDPNGRGGSVAIHDGYTLGQRLAVARPRSAFPVHHDARPALLIAGGIGITPIKSIAHHLTTTSRAFTLHYTARSGAFAYRGDLAAAFGGSVIAHPSDAGPRLDVDRILAEAPQDAVIYVCRPERLITAVEATAAAHGIAPEDVRIERFTTVPPATDAAPVTVLLARSGKTLSVEPGESILDAALNAGVDADLGCRSGTCGTCAVKVLEGTPLHRDQALTAEERDRAGLMTPCVSGACSSRLVLDL